MTSTTVSVYSFTMAAMVSGGAFPDSVEKPRRSQNTALASSTLPVPRRRRKKRCSARLSISAPIKRDR